MNINKLSTKNLKGDLDKTASSSKSSSLPDAPKGGGNADKVSIKNIGLSKNESLFAKIELEKLNQSSFERLNQLKEELATYRKAKEETTGDAQKTSFGKKLNDPEIWADIAQSIIGK